MFRDKVGIAMDGTCCEVNLRISVFLVDCVREVVRVAVEFRRSAINLCFVCSLADCRLDCMQLTRCDELNQEANCCCFNVAAAVIDAWWLHLRFFRGKCCCLSVSTLCCAEAPSESMIRVLKECAARRDSIIAQTVSRVVLELSGCLSCRFLNRC